MDKSEVTLIFMTSEVLDLITFKEIESGVVEKTPTIRRELPAFLQRPSLPFLLCCEVKTKVHVPAFTELFAMWGTD